MYLVEYLVADGLRADRHSSLASNTLLSGGVNLTALRDLLANDTLLPLIFGSTTAPLLLRVHLLTAAGTIISHHILPREY